MQSRETQITMMKLTNAGGQTKRANERSFVYRPPAWRRWRNVKTTYSSLFVKPFENGRVGNSNCCHNFYHCPVSNYIYIVATNKPLPSSKNPHFQMRLGAQPFLWKWVLFAWEWKMISMSIKGWALTLVLKQRPGGTRKWPNHCSSGFGRKNAILSP